MMNCVMGIGLNEEYLCFYAQDAETWNLEKYDEYGEMVEQKEWELEEFDEFLVEIEAIKPIALIKETD